MKCTFGKLLRDVLDANGYTQKKAADVLHVSPQTISSYLHGRSIPNIELFEAIVTVFDLDISKIFDTRETHNFTDVEMIDTISSLNHDQKQLLQCLLLYFIAVNKKGSNHQNKDTR